MKRDMKKMAAAEFDRDLLYTKMSGITCQMCHSINDVIKYIEGPVIDKNVSSVCKNMLIIIKIEQST